MPAFTLSPADWTQIVPAGGTEAVEIVPNLGAFVVSLNAPTEVGARRMSMPPIPPATSPTPAEITQLRVPAGVTVFARAFRDQAMVFVGGAAK